MTVDLRALIEQLAWVNNGDGPRCRGCYSTKDEPLKTHARGCYVAAVLAALAVEGEPLGAGRSGSREILDVRGVPFDATNHHNALVCPYCNPNRELRVVKAVEGEPARGDGAIQALVERLKTHARRVYVNNGWGEQHAVNLAAEVLAVTERLDEALRMAASPALLQGAREAPKAPNEPSGSHPRCFNCKPTAPSPDDVRWICPRCSTLYGFDAGGNMVKAQESSK